MTSHEAALTVRMRGDHARVLDILRDAGEPLTDEEIYAQHTYRMHAIDSWGPASRSGLRSRRAELVRAGFVIEVDQNGVTAAGRRCARWAAVPPDEMR